MTEPRKLRVFLCHASQDKPIVRELYQRLLDEGWIDPWLDEEKLLPGQNWKSEITKAVHKTDMVLAFISSNSVDKEGYIQKELRFVLDISQEKPDDTIFIIPVRLDNCFLPANLNNWQWVDYFGDESYKLQCYERLMRSVKLRGSSLGVDLGISDRMSSNESLYTLSGHKIYRFAGLEFVKIPAGEFLMGSFDGDKEAIDTEKPLHYVGLPYDYFIGRYSVTNREYKAYSEYIKMDFEIPKFKEDHPVVNITWYEAQNFIYWLNSSFFIELPEGYGFRLPSEAEWEKASRGTDGRLFPWGNTYPIAAQVCNVKESKIADTTPVGIYSPMGDSPFGASDMAGNVWEWTRSLWGKDEKNLTYNYPFTLYDGRDNENADVDVYRVLRGGCYYASLMSARCAYRDPYLPSISISDTGFRLSIVPL